MSCFDSGTVTDVGWVCPVCLAVYESNDLVACRVCGIGRGVGKAGAAAKGAAAKGVKRQRPS